MTRHYPPDAGPNQSRARGRNITAEAWAVAVSGDAGFGDGQEGQSLRQSGQPNEATMKASASPGV